MSAACAVHGITFDSTTPSPSRCSRSPAWPALRPNYFSELFHEKEGMTFASYVTRLRIESRARAAHSHPAELATRGPAQRLLECRFLSRVFKRTMSETPIQYRWRARYERRPVATRKRARKMV